MLKDIVATIIRPEIQAMTAYKVADSTGLIKLDAMENPHVFSPELRGAWLKRMQTVDFNRYPDPKASALAQKIRFDEQLPAQIDLMFGNGSDELIQIIIQAVSASAGPILSVSPTFVMYSVSAQIASKSFISVPLRADFSLDFPALKQAIQTHQPACVFLAYPNNPTGNLFDEAELEHIIELSPGLVVIDEAYLPFAGKSFIKRLAIHQNLLIMRTMSKLGMAGLRLGVLFGQAQLIEQFDKIRPPYNVNSLTQASVEFALEHKAFYQAAAQNIVAQRDWLIAQLEQIDSLQVFPSDANFILFKSLGLPADEIFQQLLEHKILIKCLHQADSSLAQCLRVTVGTEAENVEFLRVIKQIVGADK